MKNRWRDALRAAFPCTLPVLAGYWFLGLAYGLLMHQQGFAWFWPTVTATTVYSGSVEFVAVNLLTEPFAPLQAFVVAFLICARHLFYGVSMLERYRGTGWKKFFLIYGLSDETFAVNYSSEIPPTVDRGWFMLWVTVLDFSYWATGTLAGSLFGNVLAMDLRGLEFVMTAMFVAIFMDQWTKEKDHRASLIGFAVSAVSLEIFGPRQFVVPAMIGMLAVFALFKSRLQRKGEAHDAH